MPGVTVIFYEAPDGSSPVEEFIRAQPEKARVKIGRYIDQLRDHDPASGPLPAQIAKALHSGILELRPEWSNVEYRLLFAYMPERHAAVLVGFIKKTQSTPRSEIDRALTRLASVREQLKL